MATELDPALTSVAAPTATALVALGTSRDPDAWAWIVHAHGEAVHRLMFRIFNGSPLGDDACQQAFLAIRDASRRFRPSADGREAAAIGWLMRVACTTGLQVARTHRRRQKRERPMIHDPPVPDIAQSDGGDAEQREAIGRVMARLPERHRFTLHLHYHAGLEYPALAQAMSVTINAARVRVHRALSVLRKQLERDGVVLSISALEGVLQRADVPTIPGHAPLLHLLNAPSAPLLQGFALMATISVGLLGGCLALSLIGLQGHAAEAHPASEPAANPRFSSDPSHYQDIEVHCEFADSDFSEVTDFFTRILRIPMKVDPRVLAANPPPITLSVDHIRVRYVMNTIAALTGLTYGLTSEGEILFSNVDHPPVPVPAPTPSKPWKRPPPFVFTRVQVTPEQFLSAMLVAGGHAPLAGWSFPDTTLMSLRVTLPDALDRTDLLRSAILHGATEPGLPANAYLTKIISRPFMALTIGQALAAITQDTGLPCRFDDDSGMMPLLSRPGEPIECGTLLAQIAGAGDASLSQASDGIVIFRMRRLKYRDGKGRETAIAGEHYQDTRPAWWYATEQYAHAPPVDLPVHFQNKIISVDWQERTVLEVAADLQKRLGVTVSLVNPDRIGQRRVLMQLSPHPVTGVLSCLRYATCCNWELSPTGITVTGWEEEVPDVAPAVPEAHQASPATAPSIAPGPVTPSAPSSPELGIPSRL